MIEMEQGRPYQYQYRSQQQLIYRYHIYLGPGQVNPIFKNCQIIRKQIRDSTG